MKLLKILLVLLCFSMILPCFSACTTQEKPSADTQVPAVSDTAAETTPETSPETEAEVPTETVTDAATEGEDESETEEDAMPVEPIQIEERYFIYRIWNFRINSLNNIKKTVDTVAADGFNAIKLHIPWHHVETTAGVYEYDVFDEMIDYIVNQKGLKVAISLDLTRRKGDQVLSEEDIMRDANGNLCMGGSETGDRLQISFNSENAVAKAVAFYQNAVAHYDELFGESVLFYLPAFSQYAETEYWCTAEYDYSANAVNAFRTHLKQAYDSIEALNEAISGEYTSFDEVNPPSCTVGNSFGQLWYSFRHQSLKAVIDRLADAQKAVAKDSKFAIQVGCVYDSASNLRGTLGIADLAEKADIVWIDDGPDMNHHFSMDYIRSVLPATVELAQEIDGPLQVGATPEKYLAQGLVSFERGCTYVSAANWGMNEHYEAYRHVWQEIANTWLGDNPPEVVQPNENTPTLEISLSELFRKRNSQRFIGQYLRLTEDESFVYIKVVDDLTHVLPVSGSAVYAFPGHFSTTQGASNWYYQTYKRGTFTDMTFDTANNRWQGEGDFNLIMNGTLHPDTVDTALVFKATEAGEITCSYSFALASGEGDGVIAYILHQGEEVTIGDARNGGVAISYDAPAEGTFTLTVEKGDEIAFVINKNVSTSYDSTIASVIIEYQA